MTVSCPDCRSVFRVDPAKVPATGVRARCSVCGGVITIAAGTLPVAVTPSSTVAVGQQGGQTAGGAMTPRSNSAPQRPYTPQAPVAAAPPPSAALMTPPMPAGFPALGAPLRPTPSAPNSANTVPASRPADTK